ncbi:MAG: c-type cytochrome [Verrucomicrobiales bacterium]|nr:c-type cytochrome [Verrucomicrobiales bacterium]
MKKSFWVNALLAGLLLETGSADPFPEIYNSEKDQTALPPSAEVALQQFQLPEGFEATVFASEPEVRNPVAMAWDHQGQMWVAENYTYAEKAKRFDLKLRDRVVVFTDTDFDGKADHRKVFTDDVQMLTSVEVDRRGVWLMCPPQLLFIPDSDGDCIPDSAPVVMLDGFTVAESNYHNFANGLRWGPDGWLYGRCGGSCPGNLGVPGTPPEERIPMKGGIWRFHPENKIVEVLCHGTVNPWGHDWDRNGELFFINTVGGHLWHMIPGAHYARPYGAYPNPLIFEKIEMHADHWHYDRSGSWTDSRGGAANDLGGGHAHIGMTIYQGQHLPEQYHDKLFTWNMHGRRANVERLERDGSGYTARHEPDVFLAGDEWFRGIEINTGPDGALYGLDWSDTGECHEHTGVHRDSGRIFRFSYGKVEKPDFSELESLTAESLDHAIRNPNIWYFRQILALCRHSESEQISIDQYLTDPNPQIRLRALWFSIDKGEKRNLRPLLDDDNENIRAWTVRLLSERNSNYTKHRRLDTLTGVADKNAPALEADVLEKFHRLAATDKSGLVRLALASGLQRIPLNQRTELAAKLASHSEDAGDHNLPNMVWFGIHPLTQTAPESLVTVAATTQWPDLLRWISRALTTKGDLDQLITLASSQRAKTPHILAGIAEGYRGVRKAPRPEGWEKITGMTNSIPEIGGTIRDLSAVFGDGLALDQLRKIAFDKTAALDARQRALQSLIESQVDDLKDICTKLLQTRTLNETAVRGLGTLDDPETGKMLAANYRRFFRAQERATVIEALASRPAWAVSLLENLNDKNIPRTDLTPFHARQIAAFEDENLKRLLTEKWGEIHQSDEAKKLRIEELKSSLTPDVLAKADLSQGRLHFQMLCAACHQLYGKGGMLGPDLTGSGRADLDYLLENIVDPGAVVSAEHRVTVITMKDARILSGVVAHADDRTLTLRLLNGETVLEMSEIADRKNLSTSIMPEGLLNALQPDQVRNLIAYLQNPAQVPLPNAGGQ